MNSNAEINKVLSGINAKIKAMQHELQSLIEIRDLILGSGSIPKSINLENSVDILKNVINEVVKKAYDDNPKYRYVKLDVVDIGIKSRVQELVRGRSYFFKMIKTYFPGISLKKMASLIGMSKAQDHSTVIHALKEFDNRYMVEKIFKKEYDLVVERFKLKINEFYTGTNG